MFVLFIALAISLLFKYFDYSILLIIFLLIVEVFLNPKSIKIENSTLIVISNHLGGLYNSNKIIKIESIIKIISIGIGLDNSYDPNPDTGTGIFSGNKETNEKPFDLYQIEYLNSNSISEKIKINLFPFEYLKLEEIKRTT